MPLAYEPAFAEALDLYLSERGPIQVRPAIHDVETRRRYTAEEYEAMDCSFAIMPNVIQDKLEVTSYDGVKFSILHSFRDDSRSGPPTAAIIHVDGGGMIAGTAAMFTRHNASVASQTGVQIFSVDYRTAPENPHPAAVEDSYAALQWISENGEIFNVNPSRIGVMGDSAGGGIAAAVAIMARDRQLKPPLAKQILIYPMLDDRNLTPIDGMEALAVWNSEDNITGWTALLGERVGQDGVSCYAAPARVESVQGLPPAYIDIGEIDIFRDEAVKYAMRLARANISTEFHLYPGLPHGFEIIAPDISASKKARENRLQAVSSF